jgi:hypothetical protein
MNTIRLSAAAMSLLLFAGAANATTVINQDKMQHHLRFTPMHGKLMRMTVKADGEATIDCRKGGVLRLGKSHETCNAKTMNIMIKGSKLAI